MYICIYMCALVAAYTQSASKLSCLIQVLMHSMYLWYLCRTLSVCMCVCLCVYVYGYALICICCCANVYVRFCIFIVAGGAGSSAARCSMLSAGSCVLSAESALNLTLRKSI